MLFKSSVQLALQLARGQRRRLGLLVVCIGLGVTTLVSVDGFLGGVQTALRLQSRPILQGDISIRANQPLTATQYRHLRQMLPNNADIQPMIQLVTMVIAPGPNRTRLVELKAVSPGYPHYGDVEVTGAPFDTIHHDETAIWVQPELLPILNVKIGDSVTIGRASFVIRGVIVRDGGITRPIVLGPTILMSIRAVPHTQLTELGSRVSYAYLIKMDHSADSRGLASQIRGRWKLPPPEQASSGFGQPIGIEVRSLDDAQSQIQQLTRRFGEFLALVSLSGLILSTVAVGFLVSALLRRSLESIGVFRTIGYSMIQIMIAYGVMISIATVMGIGVGTLVGVGVVTAIGKASSSIFGTPISFSLSVLKWIQIVGITVVASMIALIGVMIEILKLKPMAMIRGQENPVSHSGPRILLLLIGILFFVIIAAHRADSLILGGGFVVTMAFGTALIMAIARWGLIPLFTQRWLQRLPFPFPYALANLARPFTGITTVITTLAMSTMILSLVVIYQNSLAQEYAENRSDTPSLFLIDALPDQLNPIQTLVNTYGGKLMEAPIVRARLAAINGQSIVELNLALGRSSEADAQRHFRLREQNLSYRVRLAKNETVISGQWDRGTDDISLESSFAKRIGASLGDKLGFDIQGVIVSGTVTSIREVKWNTFSPTFFVLMEPALLQGAPSTVVGAVSQISPINLASFQVDLVNDYPNITFIDVRATVAQVLGVIKRLSIAVAAIGAFTLLVGVLVVISIAVATIKQRMNDMALLKVLGATVPSLVTAIMIEYWAMGVVAAVSGIGAGCVISWWLLHHVLGIFVLIPWKALFALGAGVSGVVMIVGVLWTIRLTWVRVSDTLRNEE